MNNTVSSAQAAMAESFRTALVAARDFHRASIAAGRTTAEGVALRAIYRAHLEAANAYSRGSNLSSIECTAIEEAVGYTCAGCFL